MNIDVTGYDMAINNGRVMDPLTGVDAMANVGIKDGKIAAIVPVKQKLSGKKVINATCLVVAPGFINIHGHGSGTSPTGECHVRDGITTEISGNCGISGVIGAVFNKPEYLQVADFFNEVGKKGLIINLASFMGGSTLRNAVGISDVNGRATSEQIAMMVGLVSQEMKAGAMGISFGLMYHPGTTYEEMAALVNEASKLGGGASIHVRYSFPPPKDIEAITEALNLAKETNIPLIISHRGGTVLFDYSTGILMEMIAQARESGLKVATDCMPTDTGSNAIGSAIFDAPLEAIAELMKLKLSDFEVQKTVVIDGKVFMKAGEAFTSFDQFRFVRKEVLAGKIPEPKLYMHIYKPDKTFLYYTAPFTMVENDDFIWADSTRKEYSDGNPRGAGTFSKFLGYWVRERGVCDLMTGLAKTSTMAAVWLGLDNKGRVQVGCDADLTLFDPNTIIDKSTYADPFKPPAGIPYVIVNGVLAVDNGKLTGAKAGKVIKRTWGIPGVLPNLGRVPGFGVEGLSK